MKMVQRSALGLVATTKPKPDTAFRAAKFLGWVLLASVVLSGIGCIENAWLQMWLLAVAEFFTLKLITLRGVDTPVPTRALLAYLFCWPGMNARVFLSAHGPNVPKPKVGELVLAGIKFFAGLGLFAGAVMSLTTAPAWLVAWMAMVGIVFMLHFGVLHGLSWLWRRAGVNAPPIMKAPIAARSLAEFWGVRWNLAFADVARRFVLIPLARRWGADVAGGIVFLISGLVHESVISFPAKGGWGGPTLYFVIQGLGAWIEKAKPARRLGLTAGWRGHAWTLAVVVAPLPLLFHAPFIHGVVVPMVEAVKAFFL